jgi:hypothetical protein
MHRTPVVVPAIWLVALCALPRAQSDTSVDLNAPAPRTLFDGKPDLSGVWENVTPDAGTDAVTLNDIPYATFRDIGAGYRIGLPLHPWAALLKSSRMHTRDSGCGPFSTQQFNAHTGPRTIVHAPGTVAILYAARRGARQIHTDRRPPLRSGSPAPALGYSRGAWQGDTLVVLTTNYPDDVWLDMNGSPLTRNGRTIERFRRINAGTLEIEQTVDDPKAYQRPFTTRLTWRLAPDAASQSMECAR